MVPEKPNEEKKHEVGYKKPPKATRFKPGQSGNPKGRPKGSKNFSAVVKDVLNMPVHVTEKGKRKSISTQKAALLKLREGALQGDVRKLNRLLEFAQVYNDEDLSFLTPEILPASDQKIIDRFMDRNKPSASTVANPSEGEDT